MKLQQGREGKYLFLAATKICCNFQKGWRVTLSLWAVLERAHKTQVWIYRSWHDTPALRICNSSLLEVRGMTWRRGRTFFGEKNPKPFVKCFQLQNKAKKLFQTKEPLKLSLENVSFWQIIMNKLSNQKVLSYGKQSAHSCLSKIKPFSIWLCIL